MGGEIIRTVAIVCSVGAVVLALTGILSPQPKLHDSWLLAANAGLIALASLWSARRPRPPVAGLLMFIVATFVVINPFLNEHVSTSLSVATLLVILTATLVAPVGVTAAILVVGIPVWAIESLVLGLHYEGGLSPAFFMASTIEAFAGGGAIVAILGAKKRLLRSVDNASSLFSNAPVALWRNDFSAAVAHLEELEMRGVTDLATHFDNHPEDLETAIGLVTIVSTNPAAAAMLRGDPVGTGRSFKAQLLDDDSMRTFRDQFVAISEGRLEGDRKISTTRLDGTPLHALLHWSIGRIEGRPDFSRVHVAMTDTTERDLAEAAKQDARRAHRSIVEAATSAIITVDSAGRIEQWNQAAEHLFGYPAEQVIGHPVDLIVPEPLRADHRSGMVRVAKGGERRHPNGTVETTARRRNGSEFPVEVSVSTWHTSSGDLKHSAIITDITERLEVRRSLEESKDALEQLVESKDQLIASVSHELRTPLAVLFGYSQVLADNTGNLSPQELSGIYATMAEQCTDLANIIDDLLVASRTDIETIAVGRDPLDLAAVASAALEGMVDHSSGDIAVEGGADGFGDLRRVRQIVRNLVTNAMRYGGPNRRIEIEDDHRWAYIAVVDDGAGIPAEDVPSIFEPFTTSSSDESNPAAVGIGLTVSRRLARLMGGDLTYRRRGNETRFELRLPVAMDRPETRLLPEPRDDITLAPNPVDSVVPDRAVQRDERSLVLEVVADDAQSIRSALERAGHDVVRCYGPGSGTCSLLEEGSCPLVEMASGVVFGLDLESDYNRLILERYQADLTKLIPIRLLPSAGNPGAGEISVISRKNGDLHGFSTEVELAFAARSAAADRGWLPAPKRRWPTRPQRVTDAGP